MAVGSIEDIVGDDGKEKKPDVVDNLVREYLKACEIAELQDAVAEQMGGEKGLELRAAAERERERAKGIIQTFVNNQALAQNLAGKVVGKN